MHRLQLVSAMQEWVRLCPAHLAPSNLCPSVNPVAVLFMVRYTARECVLADSSDSRGTFLLCAQSGTEVLHVHSHLSAKIKSSAVKHLEIMFDLHINFKHSHFPQPAAAF